MLEANREDIEGLILWSSNRAAYQVVGCQRIVRDVKYYNFYREVYRLQSLKGSMNSGNLSEYLIPLRMTDSDSI